MNFRFAALISGFLISALAAISARGADAPKPCPSSFALLHVIPFPKWDLRNPPRLTPDQFLPQDFLERIEKEVGPVTVESRVFLGDDPLWRRTLMKSGEMMGGKVNKFSAKVRAGDKVFTQLEIFFNPTNPDTVEIEGLYLKNPLRQGLVVRQHQSQAAKGFPIDVYREASRKLMSFLEAGGYKEVQCAAQDYTVSVLYRRFVGFVPADPKSEETFNLLEHLRQLSRTLLPEDARPRSADDFSRILGESNTSNSIRAEMMERVLRESRQNLPRGVESVRDESGRLIGVVDRRYGKPEVYFLDPTQSAPTVLRWSSLTREGRLRLHRQL